MKRMVTGVTSSGSPTLGNYLGVIRDLANYQNEYDLFIFVANLHAITVPQDSKKLKEKTKEAFAIYLACGIDPEKSTIFVQSDVIEHTQLGWLLTTQATMGELSRMTQFKDKSLRSQDNISIPAGLFTYPCLMAADILLYDPSYVPVGVDQKQHLELTRDIAERMNNKYGETHIVPEVMLTKRNIKIMDLQDPTKKMSKSSDNPKAIIFILDSEKDIRNKIKAAVTDSENLIKYDTVNKPGVSNLINIYSILTNKTIKECEQHWKNKTYKDLKDDVSEVLVNTLNPIRQKYEELQSNNQLLEELMKQGAFKAQKVAYKKLQKVQNKMGINIFKK
ncbi:tryptophanyl-tRNA synthetase [Entomoplasma ellychniae]|uniref:Tryptophan--tRNA ligase n=1 Tax=Entomoplasma ellychniae TaxID=2114 RepID=A0A8E2QWJ2_9MOLU|nr:tryptophan--tRNA ligase [Entomoplasma ellychniae]PPE04986.1 tryptophanyl-tRNA synthetase [Entomoplasma ellychniae]